jgi:hypothetical protein
MLTQFIDIPQFYIIKNPYSNIHQIHSRQSLFSSKIHYFTSKTHQNKLISPKSHTLITAQQKICSPLFFLPSFLPTTEQTVLAQSQAALTLTAQLQSESSAVPHSWIPAELPGVFLDSRPVHLL